MAELLITLVALGGLIYILNLIPVFAPPTWMALSFVGFQNPEANPWLLALTGAIAATLGRLTLAGFSHRLLRQKLLSAAQRANIDVIRDRLEGRRRLTAGIFLSYAFSPLPSNLLFIAYGLTGLPRRTVALPFFAGRFCSYAAFILSGQAIGRRFTIESWESALYAGSYFVVTQIAILLILYLFTRIDWTLLLTQRKFRLIKSSAKPDQRQG